MEFEIADMRPGRRQPSMERVVGLRKVLEEFAGDGDGAARLVAAALGDPRCLEMSPETIRDNLKGHVEALRIDNKRFAVACVRRPALLCISPASSKAKIETLARLLGARLDIVTRNVLRFPDLLGLDAGRIERRFVRTAALLELPLPTYGRICLGHPGLLAARPTEIASKLEKLCELFAIDRKQGLKSVARCPALLGRDPESLNAWVSDVMALLGISREDALRLALREPKLMSQRAETLSGNVDRLAEAWKVGRDRIVTAGMSSPPLLYLDAGALAERAGRLAALLGVPVSAVHAAFLKTPGLTGRDPAEMARRAALVVRLASAMRQPISAGDLLNANPFVLTYGMERLRMRYKLARLGVWNGAWSTLVFWNDARLRGALERHLAIEPEGTTRARRLQAVLACEAGQNASD